MLSFQRLDVYQRAIELLALVYEIVGIGGLAEEKPALLSALREILA